MLQGNNVRIFKVDQKREKELVPYLADPSNHSLWWNEDLEPRNNKNILAAAANAFYSKLLTACRYFVPMAESSYSYQ